MAVLFLAAAVLLLSATPAFAYDETSSTPYPDPLGHADYDSCLSCHGSADNPPDECGTCHKLSVPRPWFGKGPHSGYSTGAVRCSICHLTHAAPADSALLLPTRTITDTCEMCHDGTGGRGVYGAILAQTGVEPGTQHRVDQTNLVPGGNASTGATATLAFGGPDGTLSCSDCHSPHDANTVAAFEGDRRRMPISPDHPDRETWFMTSSNRLLVQRPGNATSTPVAQYGSDWCIACHQGRMSGASGPVNNHPGDYGAGAFTYANVAKLSTDASTTETTMGPLGHDNRGYLMPYRSAPATRTAQQGAHYPICQQCHEDTRFVGTMAGAEASAAPFAPSLDGTSSAGNPRFQNFPHETQNERFLVESQDDLCLNCHLAE
jgi:hypothetical protein